MVAGETTILYSATAKAPAHGSNGMVRAARDPFRGAAGAVTGILLLLALLLCVPASANDGITFVFTSDPQFCGPAVDRVRSCRMWGRRDETVDWQIAGINQVPAYSWPRTWRTRFGARGGIDAPLGVVIGGDLTESAGGFKGRDGGGTQWQMFLARYEHGKSGAVRFPVYVGLGNHDLEIEPRDRSLPRDLYRDRMWDYVAERHAGADAAVPVDNFDPGSRSYSWDWGGVHLVQLHRFGGDTRHGLPSALPWLKRDLLSNASDGRPVVFFQHYGFESGNSIGYSNRSRSKWTPAEMDRFASVIRDYNVIGIFHGHDHWMQNHYAWRGYDIFSPGAAHFGQFAIVHVNGERMDVVYAEVRDADGNMRLLQESAFTKAIHSPSRIVYREQESSPIAGQ